MFVDGVRIRLDVQSFLSPRLKQSRMVGNNIMACCPYHDDDKPSFGVNVDSGVFHCLGCGVKGSFAKLVARLDGSSESDAREWLVSRYGEFSTATDDKLELSFSDEHPQIATHIAEKTLDEYRYRHAYLANRGVSEKLQRLFGVGYSHRHSAITIPWRDAVGRLVTVKFRSVENKAYWYWPAMLPRTKAATWFALDKVLRWKLPVVAITEAEIDCMSVWQYAQIGAIAIGGNQVTSEQISTLIRMLPPDTEIVIATDNDFGGRYAKGVLVEALSGRFSVSEVMWPPNVKDANDARDVLDQIVATRTAAVLPIPLITL